MKIRIKSFWPGVVGLVIATTLFLLPGKQFPQEDWFSKIYLDKWIHLGLFTLLVSLWCLPLIHRMSDTHRVRTTFAWIAFGFVVYGVTIELVQGRFIEFRSFGIDDIVADTLGCAVGFLFSLQQQKYQKR
jgi:hypothetical protein